MRTFKLVRAKDISGISGTGEVAEGVEFENGQVAMHWLSQYETIGIYSCIANVEKIHGHDGATEVVFTDPVIDFIETGSKCGVCGLAHYPGTYNGQGIRGWAECHYYKKLKELDHDEAGRPTRPSDEPTG